MGIGCFLVAVPLAVMSRLTSLCRDSSIRSHSIPAAAVRNSPAIDQDKAAYRVFLVYIRSEANPMGIRFFGTLITKSLVSSWFMSVAVFAPTAYGVLLKMLRPNP